MKDIIKDFSPKAWFKACERQ